MKSPFFAKNGVVYVQPVWAMKQKIIVLLFQADNKGNRGVVGRDLKYEDKGQTKCRYYHTEEGVLHAFRAGF